MRELVFCVVALSACTQGPKGDTGATGAAGAQGMPGERGMQGERGAPGVNPANPVWVDSQGRVLGSDALYFDDAGVLWQIDLETGTPSTYTPPIYFSQPSCTGNAWISTVLPRQAVNVDGGWFVRADDALRENVLSNSYILEGNCYPANMSPGKGVSSMSFRPVTAPALPFVGPMHRELR